jgi:ketosteroid isomerase-like protein
MSQENVDLLSQLNSAWSRRDARTMEALLQANLDPQFELQTLYPAQVYRGAAGPMELMADLRETWDDYALEAEEIVDLGEHVMVVLRMSGRGAGSGVPIERSIFLLWSFEGERAVRAKAFASREEAQKAAGLRE